MADLTPKGVNLKTLLYFFMGSSAILLSTTAFFAKQWFSEVNAASGSLSQTVESIRRDMTEISTILKFMREKQSETDSRLKDIEKRLNQRNPK